MKNDFVWSKTLLSVYRYLERIAGAIDKIILKSGINSLNICGQNFYHNNTRAITQKIIELSERKVTLINLKILVEKYLDGVKSKELMERHNISMRTVFRKLDTALKSFASCLIKKGYNNFYLTTMLKNEEWILNVYRTFANGKEDEIVLSKIHLVKAVS